MKRISGFALMILVFGLMFAGMLRTLVFPKAINYYENRYANTMPAFALSAYIYGDFQDETEAALNDQILLSQTLEKAYQSGRGAVTLSLLQPYLQDSQDHYVPFGSQMFYGGDTLVNPPADLQNTISEASDVVNALNDVLADFSDVPFYYYYIQRDWDYDFENDCSTGICENLLSEINLPETNKASLTVNGFDFYAENFCRTDHHWNCRGSYLGYLEILSLLGIDEGPLEPLDENLISDQYSGSKALTVGLQDVLYESFYAYQFSYPAYDISINGEACDEYGFQWEYLNGETDEPLSYASFYGGDPGELIITNPNSDGENLLILGDSYDNAIDLLLAAHFSKVCVIDLRNYEDDLGSAFSLGSYIEDQDIDQVLFIGGYSFFTVDGFVPEV